MDKRTVVPCEKFWYGESKNSKRLVYASILIIITMYGGAPPLLEMPDDLLLDAYKKAVSLNLCPQFIKLLELEIQRRNLPLHIDLVGNK